MFECCNAKYYQVGLTLCFSIIVPSVVMLSVIMSECRYAECHQF